MSFIYRRGSSGPKIDPWGTPHKSCPGPEKDLLKFALNFLYDRYDIKWLPKNDILENPKNYILLIGIPF